MPGERRLDGDLRGFLVADFTDHHDVGVLTKDCAQRAGEVPPDIVVDLDLVDASQLVFHRVFHRDQFRIDLVQLVERRVQRGRFARAGGTGHEHDARGLAQQFFPAALIFRREAELPHTEQEAALVQDTHDDAFAVHGRQRADAEVDDLAAERDLDAAVLRDAALGDVHTGHDL